MASAKKATGPGDVVPLRRQYLQIKSRYPDTILFFRLGDFYETFDDDAHVASRVLDLVLTGREMGKNLRVPMAGIPHHAADGYIARLIGAGHKVAVCEQVSEPSKGKGLVDRDVTRVVTPGTIVDPAMLDARTNNYIAAVVMGGARVGIAYADITTGEFRATEIRRDGAEEALLAAGRELMRLRCTEVVLEATATDSGALPLANWLPGRASVSRIEPWRVTEDRASTALLRHFDVESLDGFGCAGRPLAIRAAGSLLQYLEDTQIGELHQIRALTTYGVDSFMTLDPQTLRNLELSESSRGDRRFSLTAVLDRTRTPMGARLLRRWIGQPLLDIDALNDRLDAVAWFAAHHVERNRTRETFARVGDLERLTNRAVTGRATPRDLRTLATALAQLPTLQSSISGFPMDLRWPDHSDLLAHLNDALVEDPPVVLGKGQVFRPGFASDLDAHRRSAAEAREWIANLERSERHRTGIRTLKVGYNRVFGYYIEITGAALASAERDHLAAGNNAQLLPTDYIPKQTLANATRYFTPQLKEYETLVLTAEDTLAAMEAGIFQHLVERVASAADRLLESAATIAQLDALASFADVAVDRDYVRPVLDESTRIRVETGRHPVLETTLPAGEYVPNHAALDADDEQIVILTGPNMAGKSSWLRQVALITLMAQIGSFVPASRAEIGIVDRIFTRIGAQDDIATGQSTFMVEMLETANILHHATRRSLIVLDEIGRGTSTYDGLAIARAIIEYLHHSEHLGCKTLFATHYHELAELTDLLPRVRSYRMDVLEEGDRVVFLRQVVPGGADRSYGIHVAQLAGIPQAVIRRAQDILRDLEASSAGEAEHRRRSMRDPADGSAGQMQLTFFDAPSPVLERLSSMDIEGMSPLEAITALFELKRLARADG